MKARYLWTLFVLFVVGVYVLEPNFLVEFFWTVQESPPALVVNLTLVSVVVLVLVSVPLLSRKFGGPIEGLLLVLVGLSLIGMALFSEERRVKFDIEHWAGAIGHLVSAVIFVAVMWMIVGRLSEYIGLPRDHWSGTMFAGSVVLNEYGLVFYLSPLLPDEVRYTLYFVVMVGVIGLTVSLTYIVYHYVKARIRRQELERLLGRSD